VPTSENAPLGANEVTEMNDSVNPENLRAGHMAEATTMEMGLEAREAMPELPPVERGRQLRGKRLVERVLDSTLEELSRGGYNALSVEVVAERAGVNKTSVYRRWPTKAALVAAAMMATTPSTADLADTGKIRTDMIAILREYRERLLTRRGQCHIRMILVDGLTPEVAAIVDEVRKDMEKDLERVVARAVTHGELPEGTDIELLFAMLSGSLLRFVVFRHGPLTDLRLEQIVDVVLEGTRHGGRSPAYGPADLRRVDGRSGRNRPFE
jgi:AcrR family transcriptional regulator